ncbi:hypothetical protein BD779DRAFT_1477124 [Infundibulicybe gibba]|nr:hypothetical protein BD779DRAFT_1477124 [Infundibulicybe gibba]
MGWRCALACWLGCAWRVAFGQAVGVRAAQAPRWGRGRRAGAHSEGRVRELVVCMCPVLRTRHAQQERGSVQAPASMRTWRTEQYNEGKERQERPKGVIRTSRKRRELEPVAGALRLAANGEPVMAEASEGESVVMGAAGCFGCDGDGSGIGDSARRATEAEGGGDIWCKSAGVVLVGMQADEGGVTVPRVIESMQHSCK